MAKEMDQHARDMLEGYVDLYSLHSVLSALSKICSDKSIHIGENWQDVATAKVWMWTSQLLDRASAATEAKGV